MMEREPIIPDAIGRCVPNVGFAWDAERGIILWESEEAQPTQAEIDAMMVTLQEEWESEEYARKRQTEYPSVGDQLDMLMKDMKNGTKTHQESCEAVKAKYPK